MKQKVVIKLSVPDERTRAKAMKTAVAVDGVNSASYQHDKEQIEVMGEGVDVVVLTTSLRKTLKYADVVSDPCGGEEQRTCTATVCHELPSMRGGLSFVSRTRQYMHHSMINN